MKNREIVDWMKHTSLSKYRSSSGVGRPQAKWKHNIVIKARIDNFAIIFGSTTKRKRDKC